MKKTILMALLIGLFLGVSCTKSDSTGNSQETSANVTVESGSLVEEKAVKVSSSKKNNNAKGNFVKVDSDVFTVVTKEELSGTYSNSEGVKKGDLKFSLKIVDSSIYCELKEEGEEKALSTIKTLSEEYSVVLKCNNSDEPYEDTYEGSLEKNSNSVYNVIKLDWGLYDFVENESISIVISNELGSYDLGTINTSEIEELRYDKTPYNEAVALMEKEEYGEAILVLENYEKSDYEAYMHYWGREKISECKDALYAKALKLYLNGNYKDALDYCYACGFGYKDTTTMIKDCRKELGLNITGDIIDFGSDPYGNPIEWFILEKKGNEVLVLSRNVLFDSAFNYSSYGLSFIDKTKWENSWLRSYLNNESTDGLLNTFFTESEKARILISKHYNYEDKVFLLETDDIEKYFASDEECIAYRLEDGEADSWWLRDYKFPDDVYEYYVATPGYVSYSQKDSSRGVRPAMWITLEN